MMVSLKNKIAVVTGASSGIGKAIALELAKQEVDLCLLGRNLKTLQKVAEIANQSTRNVRCFKVDMTVDQEILNFSDSISQLYNGLDILVNCAGVISMGLLETASLEDFELQYKTNVRGPFVLTQCLLPLLRLQQGEVIFINSNVIFNAAPQLSHYAATKHALKAIADSFRQEVNADGIRVLNVYPGRTATPMQQSIFAAEDRTYKPEFLMQPYDIAMMVIATLQLPRTVEVTDINMRPMQKSV